MRFDFTAAVERALHLAAAIAKEDQSATIRPIDLFRALVIPEESQAVSLLESSGLEREKLQQLFPRPTTAMSEGEAHFADWGDLGRPVQDILAHACETAKVHGAEERIGSDHILLAILELDTSLRAGLTEAGLDWHALKQRIVPERQPLHLDEPLDFTPPAEAIDLARTIDASANRAREALRVLEDHARFILGDAF